VFGGGKRYEEVKSESRTKLVDERSKAVLTVLQMHAKPNLSNLKLLTQEIC
jgi:hypothetical protein